VPDQPQNLQAFGGNALAVVTFSSPNSDGGSPVTSYSVIATDQTNGGRGGQVATGSGSPITVTGLTNGDSYSFAVVATNNLGSGQAATTFNVTPGAVPSVPQNVSASATNGQAVVSFTPPATDGGSSIFSYVVAVTDHTNPGCCGPQTVNGSASPITVSSLTNGHAYTFTVSATNNVGTGPASAPSNSVTPATVPDQPQNLQAFAGNALAVVTFSSPNSDGGSPVTSYSVIATDQTNGGRGGQVATGSGSPITVTGLTNGDSYSFAVTATNGIGAGQPATTNAVTPMAPPNSTTSLTSSLNPSDAGQSVTFTASVAPIFPASGTPSGTVTFMDGSTVLATKTLRRGAATFATTALAVGVHHVTASFGGGQPFTPSQSSTLDQTVRTGTSTSLSASANPAVVGQTVTLTASVAPLTSGQPTPTGTVTFKAGTAVLGVGTVDGTGHAQLDTSFATTGRRSLIAVYGGDGRDVPSTSTAIRETVGKANTTTVLLSSANPSNAGQPVTFTATVTAAAPGGGIPAGSVTFKDGTATLATVSLSAGGTAALTTSALTTGLHHITVSYGGSTTYLGSISPVLDESVS